MISTILLLSHGKITQPYLKLSQYGHFPLQRTLLRAFNENVTKKKNTDRHKIIQLLIIRNPIQWTTHKIQNVRKMKSVARFFTDKAVRFRAKTMSVKKYPIHNFCPIFQSCVLSINKIFCLFIYLQVKK